MNDLPSNLWGYVILSNGDDKVSLEEQMAGIYEVWDRLEAEGRGRRREIYKESRCNEHAVYHRRPQMTRLLMEVKEGDTIVVYELTRIGSKYCKTVEFIRRLMDKKVWIVTAQDYKGISIDTSTKMGVVMLGMMEATISVRHKMRKHNTRLERMLNTRNIVKEKTVYINKRKVGKPPLAPWGMKNVYQGLDPKGRKIYERHWDEDECRFIAELVSRRNSGEGWGLIIKDIHARAIMRYGGQSWIYPGDYKAEYLIQAYQWAKKYMTDHDGMIGLIKYQEVNNDD